jgi:hypothetical protein
VSFGNYTFIITFGEARQQVFHIDSLFPNYQFSVTCVEDAPILIVLYGWSITLVVAHAGPA